NVEVGHRAWILRPETKVMGNGSTHNTNALWVVDSANRATSPQLTTWPAAGFFPSEFVPSSRRWSIHGTGGAGLAAASVKVTGPSGTISTKVINRGGDRLVWEMPTLPAVEGQGVVKYSVTISGITGARSATHSYTV